MARVVVIVPNWNGLNFIERCLRSLCAQSFEYFETVVVDNGSTDGSAELVEARFPTVRLIRLPKNRGFSVAVNVGLKETASEYVAFLNNDTEVEALWLSELVRALDAHPSAGSAASKIFWDSDRERLYAAGDFFCAEGFGGNMGASLTEGTAHNERTWVFSASACASLYRRCVLDEIGLLEERFFMFYEDIDLGFRAQLAGWPCIVVPEAVVYHTGTATAGIFSQMRRYCLARNELFVLARNLLGPILRRSVWSILRHQLKASVQALDEGWPATLLRARIAAIAALPWLLRSRRDIMAKRLASTDQIASLIRPYDEIYPPASIPDAHSVPRAWASATGARVLIIRSAGPLLRRAIDYARSSLSAQEIDVLTMPGHEDTGPSADGICAITYPRRERFCGLTMPARFAERLRVRRYDAAMILCGGDPETGFLNVDLVALRAGPKRIIYFTPDGSTREFDGRLFSKKLARFALNACLAASAFAASVVFMAAIVTATVLEGRRCKRTGAAAVRES
ncbi:MAG: glycosyltransferase family 2 protein [Candidatus Coatesbacteria bacterium]|nr:glycosyltransferase family 2 protein [Candidatus Coatesbacteria bacterium]